MSASSRVALSVVVVSYNTRDLLESCLRSIDRYRDDLVLQVIVVDNASADGSADRVRTEFPQVELIENAENLGFAAANNQAFRIATGEHVLLLNPDTELTQGCLVTALGFLADHPDVGVLGCRVRYPDGQQQPTLMRYPHPLHVLLNLLVPNRWLRRSRWLGRARYVGLDLDRVQDVDGVAGCFMLLPRHVLERVGPLDEDFFMYGEEVEWCFRIHRAGFRVVYFPDATVLHHGGQSAGQVSERMVVAMARSQLVLMGRIRGQHAARLTALLMLARDAPRVVAYAVLALVPRDPAAGPRATLRSAVLRLPMVLRYALTGESRP